MIVWYEHIILYISVYISHSMITYAAVVTVDLLVRATTPYPLDEQVMVPSIREVYQTLYLLAERGECGLVDYVTGEQQSRFLPCISASVLSSLQW